MDGVVLNAEGFESQPRVGRTIAGAVIADKLAHAYLLVGPRGVGKQPAALALGRLAACAAPALRDGTVTPCGACSACRLPFRPDRHHDLLLLDPQQKESRLSDGSGAARDVGLIDRIREAQTGISIRPLVSRRKCLIILRMDSLQQVHMSAVLKTIEEPPGHAIIILTAENPSALLPTILSRCQILEFRTTSPEELLAALGRDDPAARVAVALSCGRIEPARRLLESGQIGTLRERVARLLELALSDDPVDALRAAEQCRRLCTEWHGLTEGGDEAKPDISDEEKVRRAIDGVLYPLEAALRDSCAERLGAAVPQLGDGTPPSVAPSRAGAALRTIGAAKRAIAQNANTRLALEAMFLGV